MNDDAKKRLRGLLFFTAPELLEPKLELFIDTEVANATDAEDTATLAHQARLNSTLRFGPGDGAPKLIIYLPNNYLLDNKGQVWFAANDGIQLSTLTIQADFSDPETTIVRVI